MLNLPAYTIDLINHNDSPVTIPILPIQPLLKSTFSVARAGKCGEGARDERREGGLFVGSGRD